MSNKWKGRNKLSWLNELVGSSMPDPGVYGFANRAGRRVRRARAMKLGDRPYFGAVNNKLSYYWTAHAARLHKRITDCKEYRDTWRQV